METTTALVFFALALLGLWFSTRFLAIGYLLHGLWDLFHHPHRAGASAGPVFPPLCLAFDLVVGAYVLAAL
jgi:hypothetical protein